MVDQRHKTLRSFYCEDPLWELFEVMTHDLDCSMDYLINESMRHYARSRNYSLTGMSRLRQPEPAYEAPPYEAPGYPGVGRSRAPTRPVSQSAPTQALPAVERGRMPPVPVSQSAQTLSMPPVRPQAMPPGSQLIGGYEPRPAAPQREWPSAPRQPVYEQPGRRPTTPRMPPPPPVPTMQPVARGHMAVPPPPPPMVAPRMVQPARPPLYLFFNGQRYLIDKDRFIIGRGSQNTDLTIRDGNISRKHAAVIYHNGTYYLQDLGSTNGIEYKGTKLESKQIEEGDYFNICDYELRFSYIG